MMIANRYANRTPHARYGYHTADARGFCEEGCGRWPCDAAELADAEQANADLTTTIATLLTDVAHFAQTVHQGHHGTDAATWQECNRGACPGLHRAYKLAAARITKE